MTRRNARQEARANDPRQALVAAQEKAQLLMKQIAREIEKRDLEASLRPGGAHWGHVGDAEHTLSKLQDVKDHLTGEGEYAL